MNRAQSAPRALQRAAAPKITSTVDPQQEQKEGQKRERKVNQDASWQQWVGLARSSNRQVKPRWSSAIDTHRNQPYFYDRVTRESTWVKPANFDRDLKAYHTAIKQSKTGSTPIKNPLDSNSNTFGACIPPAPPLKSCSLDLNPCTCEVGGDLIKPAAVEWNKSFNGCSIASSWGELLGMEDDHESDTEFQNIPKPKWKSAIDPSTEHRYYYHREDRVTMWSKPDQYDEDRRLYKAATKLYKEQRQKTIEDNKENRSTKSGALQFDPSTGGSFVLNSLPSPGNMNSTATEIIKSNFSLNTPRGARNPKVVKGDGNPRDDYDSKPQYPDEITVTKKRITRFNFFKKIRLGAKGEPQLESRDETNVLASKMEIMDRNARIGYGSVGTRTRGGSAWTSEWGQTVMASRDDYIEWMRSPKEGEAESAALDHSEILVRDHDKYMVTEFPVDDEWEGDSVVSDISMFDVRETMEPMSNLCSMTANMFGGSARRKSFSQQSRSASNGR